MAQRFSEHMDSTTLLWMFFKLRPGQLLILGTYDVGVTAAQLSPHNNKHCCQNPEDADGVTALLSQERLLSQLSLPPTAAHKQRRHPALGTPPVRVVKLIPDPF